MATFTYKNFRLAVTASYSTAYTCPASTTAIVIHCQAANIDGTNSATFGAQWLDSSASNAATRLMHSDVVIPIKSSLNPIGGQLALEAGDALQFIAGATNDVEVSGSVLEIT